MTRSGNQENREEPPLPREAEGLRGCDPEVVRHLLAVVQGWVRHRRPDLKPREVNDITESTLAEAWGRAAAGAETEAAAGPSLEAWALRIAGRRLRSYLQAQSRTGDPTEGDAPEESPEAAAEAQVMRQMVMEEALAALAEAERTALECRYRDALSLEQRAERLEVTPREAAVVEYRALQSLGSQVREFRSEFHLHVERLDNRVDAAEGPPS